MKRAMSVFRPFMLFLFRFVTRSLAKVIRFPYHDVGAFKSHFKLCLDVWKRVKKKKKKENKGRNTSFLDKVHNAEGERVRFGVHQPGRPSGATAASSVPPSHSVATNFAFHQSDPSVSSGKLCIRKAVK